MGARPGTGYDYHHSHWTVVGGDESSEPTNGRDLVPRQLLDTGIR